MMATIMNQPHPIASPATTSVSQCTPSNARLVATDTAINAAPPATAADVVTMANTGTYRGEIAHTEWTDSPSHQSGFSFVMTPNTKVIYNTSGTMVDIDLLTQVEGSSATKPTYSAVTSRSYHSGNLVNVLLMDGSVRGVTSTVSQTTWRAYGTRAGGEVATLD